MEHVRVKVRARPDRKQLQLFYVDTKTRKERTKSAGTDDPAEAERAAAIWQQDLEQSGRIGRRISWSRFVIRVGDEYVAGRPTKTGRGYVTALGHITRLIDGEIWLHDIDSSTMSQIQAAWRSEGMPDTSITTHLRHLSVIFKWAKSIGLIREVPMLSFPRNVKRRLQRGRALTEPEFRKMLKHAKPAYKRIIEGMWLSGLRLNEAVALSWDAPPIRVDLDGAKYPRMVIYGEAQKSRKDEIVPIVPDFAEFLRKTPPAKRTGRVFPVPIKTLEKIGREIRRAGTAANVSVNDNGKHASAQDLRSAFGTRWKRKVHPLTLKLLMRHASLETTMKFYIDDDADEAAEEIWKGAECTDSCTKKRGQKGRNHAHARKNKRKTLVMAG